MKAPRYTPEEDAVIVAGWPEGRDTEDMMAELPGRSAKAITDRAHKLSLKRPQWFNLALRSQGGKATFERRNGRMYWSRAATDRLVRLMRDRTVQEAARALGVTTKQARKRLTVIGWVAPKKPPTPPRKRDDEQREPPQLPDAGRVAALVAQFEAQV